MIPPHHRLANSLASSTSTTEYASSNTSSRASSPRSSQSHPRHSVAVAFPDDDDDDRLSRPSSDDLRSSVTYSDAYDSSADGRTREPGPGQGIIGENPLTNANSTGATLAAHNLAVDHAYGQTLWSDSSRVSSRAASPVPGLGLGAGDGFDGYLNYRAGTTGARLGGIARSRSGFSTPTTPAEFEEKDSSYDTECLFFPLLSLGGRSSRAPSLTQFRAAQPTRSNMHTTRLRRCSTSSRVRSLPRRHP